MARNINLDMDVLRTFVTGVSQGSFAKAAEQLGRSPSAISLQLRKLEEQTGQVLLARQGRGLTLTEEGELLLSYARRILDLNDEAVFALGGGEGVEGWLRVGMPEDFAERSLPGLLGRFAARHPKVRIEARADRSGPLLAILGRGDLDLALTWGNAGEGEAGPCQMLGERPLGWIGAPGFALKAGEPLPLIAFDAPCAFRSAAITALDAAGISWRHVFASPSLAGIWAAVRAGLGVTVRATESKPDDLVVLAADTSGLPALGAMALKLHERDAAPPPPVALFRDFMIEAL